MVALYQDLKYGFRMLAKNPGFAAVAVLTLALGIGANSAIFSVVYGVLLRSLPYPKPDQIVDLREVNAKGGRMNFADPNFEDIRSQNRSLKGVAEYSAWLESVSGGSEPTRSMLASVSHDFFPLMGVKPVLGRGFLAEDQRFGAVPVALVSYGYWKQYLGGTNNLSTLKLTIENQSVSVVGVLPPGFGSRLTVTSGCRASFTNGCPAARRTIGTLWRGCVRASRRPKRAPSFPESLRGSSNCTAKTP